MNTESTKQTGNSHDGSNESCWVYRLESRTEENGLWYNANGKFVLGVADAPNCETKELPMEYDERYQENGNNWFSACKNLTDITTWYSIENLRWLVNNGFVFTRYLVQDWRHYDKESVFLKETALQRVELDIETIF